MNEYYIQILTATVASLLVVVLLWPPREEYNIWERLSGVIGETTTLVVAFLMLVAVSALCGFLLSLEWKWVLVGAVISYLILNGFVEMYLTTDSPVHFIAYGIMFGIWFLVFVLVRSNLSA